jgi:Glyoxalase-like domain
MTGPSVDHIVVAAVDLDAAVEDLATRFGIRPAAGGRHVGLGTRNFLLSLAPDGQRGPYLELIGPDPTQSVPAGTALPFGIGSSSAPKLAGFALGTGELDKVVDRARAAGHDPGEVRAMQRATPDGGLLSWRLTAGGSHDGLVPFLIDWLDSPHPSTTTPRGATLVALRGEHPDPDAVLAAHRALGWSMDVGAAPAPALVATIDTPNGRIDLR